MECVYQTKEQFRMISLEDKPPTTRNYNVVLGSIIDSCAGTEPVYLLDMSAFTPTDLNRFILGLVECVKMCTENYRWFEHYVHGINVIHINVNLPVDGVHLFPYVIDCYCNSIHDEKVVFLKMAQTLMNMGANVSNKLRCDIPSLDGVKIMERHNMTDNELYSKMQHKYWNIRAINRPMTMYGPY